MRLIKYDFFKLLSEKTYIAFVFILFAINTLLTYQNFTSQTDWYDPLLIKTVYQDLQFYSDEEKLTILQERYEELQIIGILITAETMQEVGDYSAVQYYLEEYKDKIPLYLAKYQTGDYLIYTDDLYVEIFLIETVLQEVEAVVHYPQYLQHIEDNAATMAGSSLFSQPNTFAYRNILKTPDAYSHLKDVKPTVDISTGVNLATQSSITDILSILFVVFTTMMLFLSEKEKGMLRLIKPTMHGYHSTIFSKIVVSFLICFAVVLVLYGCNLTMAACLYGLGDLSRPIQSLWGCLGSPLHMKVGVYIICYFVIKILVLFLVAMIISLLCIKLDKAVLIYISVALLFIISFILYYTISPQSTWVFFKYINLIPMLQLRELFQQYININILGYPINLWPITVLIYIGTLIPALYLSVRSYCRPESTKILAIYKLLYKLSSKFYKEHLSVSVAKNEFYRYIITNKVVLLLILFIAFQIYSYPHTDDYLGSNELYYKQYIYNLQGELSTEKEEIIAQEEERINAADMMLYELSQKYTEGLITAEELNAYSTPYQNIVQRKDAFNEIKEQLQYIKEQQALGKNPYFIYKTGYSLLFGENQSGDFSSIIKICLLTIAALSMLYVNEYTEGTIKIVHTTANGREKLFWAKYLLGILILSAINIITYVPDIYYIFQTYCSVGLSYPANSLQFLSMLPTNVTVLQYLLILYFVRLIGSLLAMIVIYAIALSAKNLLFTILASTVVILGPVILVQLGMNVFQQIPIASLLYANTVIQQKELFIVTGLTAIFIIVGLTLLSRRLFIDIRI